MSLHVCMSCGTVYAPAAACPHCGYDSFRYSWEEPDVDVVYLAEGVDDEPKPKTAAKAAADK